MSMEHKRHYVIQFLRIFKPPACFYVTCVVQWKMRKSQNEEIQFIFLSLPHRIIKFGSNGSARVIEQFIFHLLKIPNEIKL